MRPNPSRPIDYGQAGIVALTCLALAAVVVMALSGCADLSRDEQYVAALHTEKAALATLKIGLDAGVFSEQERTLIGDLVRGARLSREKMAAALLDPNTAYPFIYLDSLDIIVGELAAWGVKGQLRAAEQGDP